MLFILVISLVVAKELKINPQQYQIRFDHNGHCLRGEYSQFEQFKKKFPAFTHLIDTKLEVSDNSPKCLKLNNQSFFTFFRYGNWCGMKYGGFDNSCVNYCRENPWVPSEDCINCNPPTDYVDEQCMYHDFCMERFQYFHIGNASACNNTHTIGQYFPSPCSCPMNITEHLTPALLSKNCQNETCIENGNIIYDFFDSSLITCGCTYQVCQNNQCKNKTACVGVDECTALKGQ